MSGPIELWLWVEMDGDRPWAHVHRERFDTADTKRWWECHLDGIGLEDALWPNGDEVVNGWWYVRCHLDSSGSPWGGSYSDHDEYDEWVEIEEEKRLWFGALRVRYLGWKDRRARKQREARIIEKCGCVCRCPECRNPLNDGICTPVDDPRATPECVYEYTCGECGEKSRFRYDMPVPVRMEDEPVKLETFNFEKRRP